MLVVTCAILIGLMEVHEAKQRQPQRPAAGYTKRCSPMCCVCTGVRVGRGSCAFLGRKREKSAKSETAQVLAPRAAWRLMRRLARQAPSQLRPIPPAARAALQQQAASMNGTPDGKKKAQDSVLTSVAPPLAVRASCRSVASVRLTPQGSGWGTRASVARIPTRLQINRLQIKEP